MPNSDFGMFCKGCRVFEPDIRLPTGGIKTCNCGEKRWGSRLDPAPEAPPAAEPVKPWDLTDPDRLMLLHFGIDWEKT